MLKIKKGIVCEKIQNLNEVITIISLQLTVSLLFQKEQNTIKEKFKNVMQKSYSDYINKIDNLKKNNKENKDEVISNLAKLKNVTNHPPLKYPIVALNMMI